MHLTVTILEESTQAAVEAVRALVADHDAVEVRLERMATVDFEALRRATTKPLIATWRGAEAPAGARRAALAAGAEWVDVEWNESVQFDVPRERVILSHHDFDGMPDVESLAAAMRSRRCAHVKLAVTPATLDDNLRLLRLAGDGMTVIGMGEQGLYSRIAAPFAGSEFAFVTPQRAAAPGQLTLDQALTIYGPAPRTLRASHYFAIAGSPAGHSLSPSIHNSMFRERGIDAAYTIASFPAFEPVGAAVERGVLTGISVTAPFKNDALEFVRRRAGEISASAAAAGSANTITRARQGLRADNTDVDGFAALIARARAAGAQLRSAAIAGAGGTARAALVATREAGIPARVFNRRSRPFPQQLEPLEGLPDAAADLVLNTIPAGAHVPLPPSAEVFIEAAYPSDRIVAARWRFGGIDLLHAQAIRQNEIFIEAIRESRTTAQ